MWEEPCISGKSGSGAVFFSGCNMGCVFCQNKLISRGKTGKYIADDRLVEIFFELREKGAKNINLVTGDIFIPTIRNAIERAKTQGFDLPFLLNTSSYVSVDAIKSLEGLVDIYLPDFKYYRNEDAVRYSNAPGYVEAAKAAIDEMVRQHPACIFEPVLKDENTAGKRLTSESEAASGDENLLGQHSSSESEAVPGDESMSGHCPTSALEDVPVDENMLKEGVVVRHLLMPGMVIQAKLILRYLYERYGDKIYISMMNQFTPNGELDGYPEINRKVSEREYDSLIKYAKFLGLRNGFVQIGDTAKESFIPDFDCEGV